MVEVVVEVEVVEEVGRGRRRMKRRRLQTKARPFFPGSKKKKRQSSEVYICFPSRLFFLTSLFLSFFLSLVDFSVVAVSNNKKATFHSLHHEPHLQGPRLPGARRRSPGARAAAA